MTAESTRLLNYAGPNPFHESQGRMAHEGAVISEFYPTSSFWSRFNSQHEILLGTRGSGKTFILKMMSYSLLRSLKAPFAEDITRARSFIGFYVPLHLECLASLAGKGCSESEKQEYFQFAFNCAAAKALLREIETLLHDVFENIAERATAEYQIIQTCQSIWLPENVARITSLADLQWQIEVFFATRPFWPNGGDHVTSPLDRQVLAPIVSVLPKVASLLNLDPVNTQWIACIDEAEFLGPSFIQCINSSLRSNMRPLVVKMATLPFKHSTKETLVSGVSVQANGNDFDYRVVDLKWDESDYDQLTNHICAQRLSRCGCSPDVTVETFLGKVGESDDLIDYYRAEMGTDAAKDDVLLAEILQCLSAARQSNYQKVSGEPEKVTRPILHRFAPVYFFRRMRLENSKGARVAAWFAGAKVVRRISDGNPRRFIQVMNRLVEAARAERLTPRAQHRVLTEFCKQYVNDTEGYPEYGPLLKELINTLGVLLTERIHGDPMTDGGCDFRIQRQLLEVPFFHSAIEFAIAYSLIITDERTLKGKVDADSEFRLSFVFAVPFWLPMRKGEATLLRAKGSGLGQIRREVRPVSRNEQQALISEFQLELFESADNDVATPIS